MSQATAIVINGADFSAKNVGNIFGLPALPVGIRFAHLTRTALANAAKNVGKIISPAESPYTLANGGYVEFGDTYQRSTRVYAGIDTPYVEPEEFTYVVVGRGVSSGQGNYVSTRTIFTFDGTQHGAWGAALYRLGNSGGTAQLSVGYHDEETPGDATRADVLLTDCWPNDVWSLCAGRYNATTRTMSIIRPITGTVADTVIPAGNVLDRRLETTLRLGGDKHSTVANASSDMAMVLGWERPLTDAEIITQVYPRLKAYLATKGVTVV